MLAFPFYSLSTSPYHLSSPFRSAHSNPENRGDPNSGHSLTVDMQTERHSYEKCQYDEFKKRVAKMDEIRAAKGGARSN